MSQTRIAVRTGDARGFETEVEDQAVRVRVVWAKLDLFPIAAQPILHVTTDPSGWVSTPRSFFASATEIGLLFPARRQAGRRFDSTKRHSAEPYARGNDIFGS